MHTRNRASYLYAHVESNPINNSEISVGNTNACTPHTLSVCVWKENSRFQVSYFDVLVSCPIDRGGSTLVIKIQPPNPMHYVCPWHTRGMYIRVVCAIYYVLCAGIRGWFRIWWICMNKECGYWIVFNERFVFLVCFWNRFFFGCRLNWICDSPSVFQSMHDIFLPVVNTYCWGLSWVR